MGILHELPRRQDFTEKQNPTSLIRNPASQAKQCP